MTSRLQPTPSFQPGNFIPWRYPSLTPALSLEGVGANPRRGEPCVRPFCFTAEGAESAEVLPQRHKDTKILVIGHDSLRVLKKPFQCHAERSEASRSTRENMAKVTRDPSLRSG